MKRAIIAAVLALCFHAPATAEMSGKEMIQKIDEKSERSQTLLYVLDGYSNGAGWANQFIKARGDAPLYCPPKKLALTPEQTASILREYLKKDKAAGESPAGLAMLLALMATFPCE